MKEIKYRVYIGFTDDTPLLCVVMTNKADVKTFVDSMKKHPKFGHVNVYEFWEESRSISYEFGNGVAPETVTADTPTKWVHPIWAGDC
jgi:hypothetical protein